MAHFAYELFRAELRKQPDYPFSHPGFQYFVLKIEDSRRQEWRYEQRFDKLYEALEVISRFVLPTRPGTNATNRVLEALEVCTFHDDDLAFIATKPLREALRALNERIRDEVSQEERTKGYAPDAADSLTRNWRSLLKHERRYEAAQRPGDRIEAFLRYVVCLRNCRAHAYAATSGDIIGHQHLLEPVCDALEHLLLLLAPAVFDTDSRSVEAAVGGA